MSDRETPARGAAPAESQSDTETTVVDAVGPFEPLRGEGDRVQRVADLVRDAGSERPGSGENTS